VVWGLSSSSGATWDMQRLDGCGTMMGSRWCWLGCEIGFVKGCAVVDGL
jgi:hypothetical protein